jgi:hypothetical protein
VGRFSEDAGGAAARHSSRPTMKTLRGGLAFRPAGETKCRAARPSRISSASEILGHSGLRMVMRYVHPQQEHKEAAMVRYQEYLSSSGLAAPPEGRLQ